MIFKYKIHCITEGSDQYWELPDTAHSPTHCPNNSAHQVDLSSVVVMDTGEGPKEVVTQYEKNDKDLKLAKGKCAVGQDGSATVSLKIPGAFGSGDGRYVAGGYAISADYNADDFVTVRIVDNDRSIAMMVALQINASAVSPVSDQTIQQMGVLPGIGLAFPQYPVVRSYTDDQMSSDSQGWYFWPIAMGNNIPPIGECEVNPIGGYGFLPSGFYIVVTYQRPNGVTTGTLRVNFDWGRKE